MSQNAVERALGKLVTDDEFCARFFENPAAATWEAGLPLSALELDALSNVDAIIHHAGWFLFVWVFANQSAHAQERCREE